MTITFGIDLKWKRWYYNNLYLQCYFLADVFAVVRNNNLKNYRLYKSSHYLSAPALSWDALLSMTKIKL